MDDDRFVGPTRALVIPEADGIIEFQVRVEPGRIVHAVYAPLDPRIPIAQSHIDIHEGRLDLIGDRLALRGAEFGADIGQHRRVAGIDRMVSGYARELLALRIQHIDAGGIVADCDRR